MTTPDDQAHEADIPLAAELALGVLDGEPQAEAMRRVLAEPAFAREVEAWRAHFAMLFAEWPEAQAGPDVEARVLAALAGDPAESSVTPMPRTTMARRNPWAWASGAATLVAASLVLALALRPERIVPVRTAPVEEPAPLVAVIAPTTGGPAFAGIYDVRRGEVRLAGDIAVPAGRSAELWAIGKDSTPHALGVFDGSAGARIAIGGRNLARLGEGVTLAVSIEPVGGSPTALPTGPVVATGTLART